jgi:hypothetical protein
MTATRNIVIAALFLVRVAAAQVTFTNTTSKDAFVATGSPDNPVGTDLTADNFGGAGALLVCPASFTNGELRTVMQFDVSGAASMFNTNFGTNQWTVTRITLQLTSNYGTNGAVPNNALFGVIHGGRFVIEWLSDNDWVEGTGKPNMPTVDGVTWNIMTDTLLTNSCEILCTNTYTPPGNNVHEVYTLPLDTNLLAEITGGGSISFLLYAADDQIDYLFNSHEFANGNEPIIGITAAASAPPLEILSGAFTNGVFQITATGSPDVQYQVQCNSDLSTTNWQNLGPATANDSGVIQFEDTQAASQSRRFYRIATQ